MDDYTELYVEAVLDTFRARLPGVLEQMNEGRPESQQIAAPRDEAYSDGTEEVIWTKLPWIEVACGDDELTSIDIGRLHADVAFDLIVVGWVDHPASARIASGKAKRLGRALTLCLMAADSLDPMGGQITRVRRRQRTNPMTNEREQDIAAAMILLSVSDTVALG